VAKFSPKRTCFRLAELVDPHVEDKLEGVREVTTFQNRLKTDDSATSELVFPRLSEYVRPTGARFAIRAIPSATTAGDPFSGGKRFDGRTFSLSIHVGRIARCDRHHRRIGGAVAASSANGARSGAAFVLFEQLAAT
jgi:hypothetical protein